MSRITHSDSMHRGDALGPFTQDQINLFRWLFRDGFDMIVGSDGLAFLELAVGGTVYLGASGDNSLNLTVNDETPGGGNDAKAKIIGGNGLVLAVLTADPAAGASEDGQIYYNSTSDVVRLRANGAWTDLAGSGGAPSTADYLVGTADAGLSAEIVVGTTPGGELGGTWASPTVDATHSGSTHSAATDTHIADGSAAHAASAIAFTPNGSIAATDVQAAIVEVRDEASGSGIPATIVDAKGDLIAATAADTVTRLAVGATGGHVLTVDAAEATGMKWAAAAAGGGAPTTSQYLVGALDGGLSAEKVKAALYKNYDPDEYPTSGLTVSDEFDDSSLDGAWTWTTAPGGAVSESTYPGYLYLDDGTNNTSTIRYLRRAFVPGAAAFSVAAKVSLQMENGNFSAGVGIALLDSGDAEIYAATLVTDGTTTASKAHRIAATPATWGPLAPGLPNIAYVYLLVTRDATTNFVVYFSFNGITWHRLGGSSVATTVSKVAIKWSGDTDSNNCEGLVDFVRVFTTVTRKIGA